MTHNAETVCAICGHPIDRDGVFGWLHKDFGPDGRSFDHAAEVVTGWNEESV